MEFRGIPTAREMAEQFGLGELYDVSLENEKHQEEVEESTRREFYDKVNRIEELYKRKKPII